MEVIKLDDLLVSLEDIDKVWRASASRQQYVKAFFALAHFAEGISKNADGPGGQQKSKRKP